MCDRIKKGERWCGLQWEQEYGLTNVLERVVQTLTPMQNSSGGFGGGHGHISHCAATYAAILSLAILGDRSGLELIDRRAL